MTLYISVNPAPKDTVQHPHTNQNTKQKTSILFILKFALSVTICDVDCECRRLLSWEIGDVEDWGLEILTSKLSSVN